MTRSKEATKPPIEIAPKLEAEIVSGKVAVTLGGKRVELVEKPPLSEHELEEPSDSRSYIIPSLFGFKEF